MPRRRAIGLLGTTLVAVVVPGLRSRAASASMSTRSATCGRDRRTCMKGAEANFEVYCCPAPSWQWFCGGQDNSYRCINTCKSGTKFPCTALIPHRDSGINGVCCDRKLHSGCSRIGPPRQAWAPSCCPKGFGFCGGVCCQPPNRCKNGRCKCPNGTESCDGRSCCKRGQSCKECFSFGTQALPSPNDIDGSVVGRRCCPSERPYCCGDTCCKEFGCCGGTCCPFPSRRCARSRGRDVCCSRARLTTDGDDWVCCPAGTISDGFGGCCPASAPECCGGPRGTQCGAKQICVRGACVSP